MQSLLSLLFSLPILNCGRYAWTIVSCSRCWNHLGWHFTHTSKSSSDPNFSFWGLRISSISEEPVFGTGIDSEISDVGGVGDNASDGTNSSYSDNDSIGVSASLL